VIAANLVTDASNRADRRAGRSAKAFKVVAAPCFVSVLNMITGKRGYCLRISGSVSSPRILNSCPARPSSLLCCSTRAQFLAVRPAKEVVLLSFRSLFPVQLGGIPSIWYTSDAKFGESTLILALRVIVPVREQSFVCAPSSSKQARNWTP
jgi:hypothetical protein